MKVDKSKELDKSRQYDVAAAMALSGLRFWESNMQDNFEIRCARIMANMIKNNRQLLNEYLDIYCIEAHETARRHEELEKERLPKRSGW